MRGLPISFSATLASPQGVCPRKNRGSFRRWEPHLSPRSPWSSLSQDTSRATPPTSMRPSRCTTPCLRPAYHSSPGFPTRQSHQTPPSPSSLPSGCLARARVVAHHISLRLVRLCFPPLRYPSTPCFVTRWDVIAALPQTLNSHVAPALVWRESRRGQGMVRRCSLIKCRVCVKIARPLLPRPIKAARVGGRYPEVHNISAAHFAAPPLECFAQEQTPVLAMVFHRGNAANSSSFAQHRGQGREQLAKPLDAGLPIPG